MPSITPFLWFDDNAEEAVEHYTAIFPNSRIVEVLRHGEAGPGAPGSVLTIDFELDGTRFTALNGGQQPFHFDESISFSIECADQGDVDYYWGRLTEGGEEGPCGWCKDRFGLSWQVVPKRLIELITDDDPAVSQPAMEAMMQMHKIDVAALEEAVGARA